MSAIRLGRSEKIGRGAENWNIECEILHPEHRLHPRVYYISLPKRFIAGTVYCPSKKVVVKDATCTLISEEGNQITKTDGFGDFWFEGSKVGIFSLKIESIGKAKTIDSISTEKDVNLGDIPL